MHPQGYAPGFQLCRDGGGAQLLHPTQRDVPVLVNLGHGPEVAGEQLFGIRLGVQVLDQPFRRGTLESLPVVLDQGVNVSGLVRSLVGRGVGLGGLRDVVGWACLGDGAFRFDGLLGFPGFLFGRPGFGRLALVVSRPSVSSGANAASTVTSPSCIAVHNPVTRTRSRSVQPIDLGRPM